MIHHPPLTADAARNRRVLQGVLDTVPAGKLELPPGTHVVADGLRVPGGWTIRGSEVVGANGGRPGSWLVSTGTTGHPVLHILGSDVSVSDLGLRPPPADPGEHGGDRGTAITVGDYLYASPPEEIARVDLRRVHVERTGERRANGIAVMGAVRDVTLHDVTVRGGYTGLAVHWGAVGADVSSITAPTYHPHRVTVTDLRVREAVEGFYLSSVHDVQVVGCCLRDVEIGFRLLPGDNTDRFTTSPLIGSDIEIADACVAWTGSQYGVRVAGWGRSEIDGAVTRLGYTNVVIRDCRLIGAGGTKSWSPVLVESASGVELRNIRVDTSAAPGTCCALD